MTIFRRFINTTSCRSMHTLKRLERPISVAPMVDITTPVSLSLFLTYLTALFLTLL